MGYGKHAGRMVSKVDNTLTQMDFVVMAQKELKDDDEDMEGDLEDEEEGYVQEKEKIPRELPRARESKRRKTMGDLPESTSNSYHTQTITQLDWSFSSAMEGEGDDEPIQEDAPEEAMEGEDEPAREDAPEQPLEDAMEGDGSVDDNPTSSRPRKSTKKGKLPKVSRFYKKKSPDPALELDTQGRNIYDGPYSSDKAAGNSKPTRNSRKRISTIIQEEDTEDEGGVNISNTISTPQLENSVKKSGPQRSSRRRVSAPIQKVDLEEGTENVDEPTFSTPEASKDNQTTRVLRKSTRKSITTEEVNTEVQGTPNSPIQAKVVKASRKARPAKKAKKSVAVAPEEDQAIFDGPFSPSPVKIANASKKSSEPLHSPQIASQAAMPPPPTPHRPIRREIPSSQSPAVTPLSAIRTPLREQAINATPIPFNAIRTPRLDTFEPPRLEIRDTFDTVTDDSNQSVVHSSPTKKSSPTKNVRFIIPGEEENAMGFENGDDVEESNVPESPSKKMGSKPPRPTQTIRPSQKSVIQDSDAEESNVPDSPSKDTGISLPRPTQTVRPSHRIVIQDSDADDSDEDEDTIIGEAAPHVEVVVEESMVQSNLNVDTEVVMEDEVEVEARENLPNNSQKEQHLEKENSQQEQETCYGEIGLETQFAANHLLQPARISPELGIVDEHDEQEDQEEAEEVEEHLTFKEKTQMMESQRLTTQHVLSMDPRTMDSDVFFSASHLEVAEIVNRTRDYLFRAWVLPSTVSRIWIYETKPISTLRYMAVLGPTKKPGEELVSETGKGNATFDKKNNKWRAYAIFELYELADPLSLAELKSNEWLERAPPKFTKVPPAVLDQLMANLLPPLWADAEDEDSEEDEPVEDGEEDLDDRVPASPVPSRTDTDAATSQLLHTIRQFTQPVLVRGSSSSYPSSPPVKVESQYTGPQFIENSQREETPIEESHVEGPDLDEAYIQNSHPDVDLDAEEERIPSSQQSTPRNRPPGPSQATTVDLTQTQTETPRHRADSIILESPIRAMRSSSPLRLPSLKGSDTSVNQPPESLVPYSMDSSEIMTKSQMLPESLMAESMWEQPPMIMDSEEESDD